jgi:UDP-glucose 4-epimerase
MAISRMTTNPPPSAPAIRGVVTVVTGATGLIGRQLVRALLEGGAVVHAVSRSPRPHGMPDEVIWWQCDPAEQGAVGALIERVRPSIVHHLAALVQGARDRSLVWPTLTANLLATVEVLDAVTGIGCDRLVLSGSLLEGAIVGFDGQPVPTSPYGAAKWAADGYARMYQKLFATPVVILRPAMAYGPGQEGKLVPYVARELLAGRSPALSSGERECDWVYSADVAHAYIAAGSAAGIEGRTIDLGTGILTSVSGVVEAIVEHTGGSSPSYGAVAARPMEQTVAVDTEPARALLGWTAQTPLREGLRQTVEWIRSTPIE